MATVLEYKCPCCGGKVEFDPNIQEMKCPFCDSVFSVEALKHEEEKLNEEPKQDEMNWGNTSSNEWDDNDKENMKVYSCKSCGGEIIADSTTSATHCPYCGNPVVFTGQISGSLKPDYVIPFQFDKKSAMEKYKQFITGRKLLPKNFKDKNHIDEIKGVYVPFWLYDADSHGDFSFRGTHVRTWSDSKYNYTETSYFSVEREGEVKFRHVPVDGSSKMPDDLMESIEPYDFSKAVDFQTPYLSGYFADKYDVDDMTCVERANERIKTGTENALRDTVHGYSSLTTQSKTIKLNESKAKYALYPVWLLSTTYKDKNYLFAMNGQTGKFVGDLPCDKKAAARLFGILSAASSLGIFGVLYALFTLK